MKKILHLQIPTPHKEWNPEILGKFIHMVKEVLGDDWAVIASPCSPSVLMDGDIEFKNFQLENLTKEEFEKEYLNKWTREELYDDGLDNLLDPLRDT